ncbi:MAG: T9SS type A sorting domain-containing protein, partial [Bacteroidales bacterium]|nr:T9SS type A sorting domain-containing protein [Bacteroidales bacterium]
LYSIDTVQYATAYEWLLEPEEAGTLLSLDTLAEVTWNPQFEGQAVVRARSLNDCGHSGWSEPGLTMVYPCMGVNEHEGMGAWGHGGVLVYPNPTRGMLNVECLMLNEGASYSLEIYDIFGRQAPGLIVSLPPGGGRAGDGGWTVDVSGLVPGIYLAVVRDQANWIGSGKFVVVR